MICIALPPTAPRIPLGHTEFPNSLKQQCKNHFFIRTCIFLLFLNSSIVDLQWCVHFCSTAKWFGGIYIYTFLLMLFSIKITLLLSTIFFFIPNLNFLLDSSSSPSGTEDALGEDSELRVARKAGNLGVGSVGGGARSCQSSQLLAESSQTNSGSGVHSGRS